MARVIFAAAIQRHVASPEHNVQGATVGAALAAVFAANPKVKDYVLDEQGHLRRHVTIFVDGRRLRDRVGLGDPVAAASKVYVVQALSGG